MTLEQKILIIRIRDETIREVLQALIDRSNSPAHIGERAIFCAHSLGLYPDQNQKFLAEWLGCSPSNVSRAIDAAREQLETIRKLNF